MDNDIDCPRMRNIATEFGSYALVHDSIRIIVSSTCRPHFRHHSVSTIAKVSPCYIGCVIEVAHCAVNLVEHKFFASSAKLRIKKVHESSSQAESRKE